MVNDFRTVIPVVIGDERIIVQHVSIHQLLRDRIHQREFVAKFRAQSFYYQVFRPFDQPVNQEGSLDTVNGRVHDDERVVDFLIDQADVGEGARRPIGEHLAVVEHSVK